MRGTSKYTGRLRGCSKGGREAGGIGAGVAQSLEASKLPTTPNNPGYAGTHGVVCMEQSHLSLGSHKMVLDTWLAGSPEGHCCT